MSFTSEHIAAEIKSIDLDFIRCNLHGFEVKESVRAEYRSITNEYSKLTRGTQSTGTRRTGWSSIIPRRSPSPESVYETLWNQLLSIRERMRVNGTAELYLNDIGKFESLADSTSIKFRTRKMGLRTAAGYSFVFAAETLDGTPLVLKGVAPITKEVTSIEKREELSRELEKWRKLSHDNILSIIGTANHEGTLYLVSPFAENGHILDYLKHQPSKANIIRLLQDVASALHYLHVEKGLVHGDIKPPNILVSSTGRAMLCDFATIKEVYLTSSANSRVQRSLPYLAPELIDLSQEVSGTRTPETDMWAFGMSVAQIIQRSDCPWEGSVTFDTIRRKLLRRDDRPSRPSNFTHFIEEDVWRLAACCWKREAKDRLKIPEVITRLNRMGATFD